MKLGIIGFGVVGSAMKHIFPKVSEVLVNDPKLENSVSYTELYDKCDVIFVCVPTPMKKAEGAEIDTRILDSVIYGLEEEDKAWKLLEPPVSAPVICIKSTVIPSKLKEYQENTSLNLTMSPEYLTEANPIHDAVHMKSLVVGGKPEHTNIIVDLYDRYSICLKPYPVGEVDLIAAGVLKYMENCFLALKVTFMNQFFDVLKESGSEDEWQHVAEVFHLDTRMGNSHYSVPGPDGDRGWGGKCVTPESCLTVKHNNYISNTSIKDMYDIFKSNQNDYFEVLSTDEACKAIEYKKIKCMTRRDIDEEIFVFETESGCFRCTSDHLIPVERNGKKLLLKAKDVLVSDKLFKMD